VTTFFLDPISGDDAKDGTTFANRVKTFLTGLPAARIAPGDTIRVIASPDPTSLGNATWTNGSRTVTLATVATLTIDNCDTAWTGATNVTSTVTATGRKQGTNMANLAVAAAFTTGKVAYRTLPSALDLSSYQQVSSWIKSSAALAHGVLELRLCSDTTGDVPVHAIPIDGGLTGGAWRIAAKDFAANLNAAIASVSLFANSDPGTLTINIDNIIACKASSDPAALTHLSLIGKNTAGEPEWYPILSIDGTTVDLGGAPDATIQTANTIPRNYVGTTETVTTYRLQPLDPVNGLGASSSLSSTNRVFQDSGTDGNPITISGGWDRTAMSAQSGQTWITGAHFLGGALSLAGRSFVNHANIGYAHFAASPYEGSTSTIGVRWEQLGTSGCGFGINLSNTWGNALYADVGNVVSCGQYGVQATTTPGPLTVRARRITGCYNNTAAGVRISVGTNCTHRYYVDKSDNHNGYGVSATTSSGPAIFHNLTASNNTLADVFLSDGDDVLLINPTLSSAAPVLMTSAGIGDALRIQKYNGGADDHRVYNRYWTLMSDATTRHAASGIAWRLSPLSATIISSQSPAEFPLAQIRLPANVTKNIGFWVRRDSLSLSAGIKIRGGQVAGIASDVSAAMSAAINTWEQLTLNVTATETGVVEVVGWGYGGTTFSAWFDDGAVA
jgi:hypothetical protein